MKNNQIIEINHLFDKASFLSKFSREKEKSMGDKYNIFQVINMTSNETSVHSAFIGDLLNPKGLHQFGDIFLQLFIDYLSNLGCNFPTLITEDAAIICEKYIGNITQTEGGRLDIEIVLKTYNNEKFHIIIENKIYATDQINQMIRYFKYGEQLCKNNFILLYLSLDGEIHDEEKTCKDANSEIKLIRDEHYYTLSYSNDILNWLETCREKAANYPLVREGIGHYINLIKYLTGQSMNIELKKEIAELIIANPKYIENIEVLKAALKQSEIELQTMFWKKIIDRIIDNGIQVNHNAFKYVFERGHNYIANYYNDNNNINYRNYGIEMPLLTIGDIELFYGIRIDHYIYGGIGLNKIKENGICQDHDKILSNLTEEEINRLDNIINEIKKIKNPDPKQHDINNYYKCNENWLAYKRMRPLLCFKHLNEADTLTKLTNIDKCISEMVDEVTTDIILIKNIISNKLGKTV